MPQTDGSIVFARWRQCIIVPSYVGTLAPPVRIWLNLCFLRPTRVHNQMANRSIQPLLHSSSHKVPILYNGQPFPPKLSLLMGRSGPPSNSWFLGSFWAHNPNGITSHFHTGDHRVSILYNGPPLSPKIVPSHGDLEPHLIHDSLGPSEPITQTASRLVQPFL